MNIPIEIKSPFAQIAEIYCPNVYQQLITQNVSTFLFTNTNLVLFCLLISFLFIFIFMLLGYFLSYLRTIRMILFAILYRFYKSCFGSYLS
jgi:hypothetical protein